MRKIHLFIFAVATIFLVGVTGQAWSCEGAEDKSCPMMERAIKEGKPIPECCLKHLQEKKDKKEIKKGRTG